MKTLFVTRNREFPVKG